MIYACYDFSYSDLGVFVFLYISLTYYQINIILLKVNINLPWSQSNASKNYI